MLDLGIAGTPRGGYNKNHLSPAAPPGSGSFAQSAPHNCVREAWAPRGQDPPDLIVQEVDDMNMSDELGSNETWARPATPRANRPAVQLQQSGVMQQVLQQPAVQQLHTPQKPHATTGSGFQMQLGGVELRSDVVDEKIEARAAAVARQRSEGDVGTGPGQAAGAGSLAPHNVLALRCPFKDCGTVNDYKWADDKAKKIYVQCSACQRVFALKLEAPKADGASPPAMIKRTSSFDRLRKRLSKGSSGDGTPKRGLWDDP